MTAAGKMDVTAWVRVIWVLTAAIFFGIGIGAVWWPSAQAIASVRAQAKGAYDEANQNESEIRHAAQLRAVAERVSRDVSRLAGQDSESATTAMTLRILNAQSRKFGVEIGAIVPRSEAAPDAPNPGAVNNRLTGTEVEIDLRGRFRNVLSFVSDLPRHEVLIRINSVDVLQVDASRPDRPVLTVKMAATLFRCRCIVGTEVVRVPRTL
jgi:hypothetical protein